MATEGQIDQFLTHDALANWWDLEDGCIHYCRYSESAYHNELFLQLGVRNFRLVQNAVVKRQAEFLAGRYCAARALVTLGADDTVIESGEHRQPLWPDNIMGSISHSGDYAMACVTRSGNISGLGIDIEKLIDEALVSDISPSILTPSENLQSLGNRLTQAQKFTLIFSIKESFFKAAFRQVGRYFDFDAISVDEIDESQQHIGFKINQNLSEDLYQGRRLLGRYMMQPEDYFITLVTL